MKGVKKNLSAFIFLYLFLFLTCLHKATGQPIQKISSQTGPIQFSGILRHPAGSPSTVLFKSIPEKQLIYECSFFGGDSL
jgi:hypothetical protein